MKNQETVKEQLGRRVMQESELAKRWGLSVKTLQKWRQQGIGPAFMKLSSRVVYPITAIEEFEHDNMRKSTSEKA